MERFDRFWESLTPTHCYTVASESKARQVVPGTYLSATNTVSTCWAWVPKTFLKNKEATVVPDSRISFFEDALHRVAFQSCRWQKCEVHARKI